MQWNNRSIYDGVVTYDPIPPEYHQRLAGLYWVWDPGDNSLSQCWAAGPIPPAPPFAGQIFDYGFWRRPTYEESDTRWNFINGRSDG